VDPTNIIFLVVFGAFVAWKIRRSWRSPAELRAIAELLAQGALLVDVRTPGEFAAGHIPGAQNVPVGATGKLSREKRSRGIVVYCASGMRSAGAAGRLRAAGFEKVLDLGPMGNHRRLPQAA